VPDVIFVGLAAGVVAVHAAFVLFAALGGVAVLRWPRVAWVHVPCVLWAAWIELAGGICPLTPLENALRARAGLDSYSGDFVARYVLPVLYPEGLTRGIQVAIGVLVLAINGAVYGAVMLRRRRR
jgi:Protein of Unknown function (DUF2784)